MAAPHVTTPASGASRARADRFDGGSAGGFALLEVSIAALLLGITVVGIAVMFSVGQGFIASEGDNRVSLFLAQQRLEQIRALGFENALPTDPTNNACYGDPIKFPPCTLTAPRIDEDPVSAHPGYRRRTSIVCLRDDEPLPNPTGYTAVCPAGGGSCPTTAPFCPTTHSTRMVIVTVENVPNADAVVDRETRALTVLSVLVRRCLLNGTATTC